MAVLRTGAQADPDQAFGDRQPGVRIHLRRPAGTGHLEDGGAAVPQGVVETYLCDAGATMITFDAHDRPLDVGRDRRLFTRAQRVAIAARDGGCLWPSCTAPISWCEFHHIDHWRDDHGRTDVDDGVPLCRNCHLRLHNGRWRITRTRDPESGADSYWLHPPPGPRGGVPTGPVRLRSRAPSRFVSV